MATSTAATPSSVERQAPERSKRAIAPPVDIYETDKEFVILADIPGVGPDGLEVTAENDTLTIRGRVERPPPKVPTIRNSSWANIVARSRSQRTWMYRL